MLRHPSLHPLSHQHHNGLALVVLAERALRADPSPPTVARLAAKAVDRFDLELVNHFELEETLLFPAIEQATGANPLVAVLVSEHRRLEQLAARLRTAPDRETLDAFIDLLRTHIRTEESQCFEHAQQTLSEETLRRIGVELANRAVRICLEP